MGLESLLAEIRARGEAELAEVEAARAAEAAKIAADREIAIARVRDDGRRAGDLEAARERTQRLAAAKLKARKRLYEAREARLEGAVEATRSLLAEYTEDDGYPAVLKRMVEAATATLGRSIKVKGRRADAAALQKAAGRAFDPAPLPIVGGLVAETADGSRRLNLSFDELLRLREDKVREILA